MTDQTPNTTPQAQEEPFIPPQYMLYLALAGLLVALFVAFTQPNGTQNVVFWGGLGFAVLSIIAWALLAPQQLKDFLTGRTLRFGGTSLIVTIVFIAALVAIYSFVKSRDLRYDLTERNQFSLTEEARQAIAAIGADPTLPQVKLLAFYGASQAGRRDQDSVLLDDYQTTSAGKITYEFVDPDRNPALANEYGVRDGEIAVVALVPQTTETTESENGESATASSDGTLTEDVENAEIVNTLSQDQLTNAILRVAASGNFRAYVLNVEGGLPLESAELEGMTAVRDNLVNQYDWTVEQVTIFDLTAPESDTDLLDPNANGTVLVIPGGTNPLTDEEMNFIANYVDNGGDLIILASPSSNNNGEYQSLATSPNLSDYLYNNFGLRFANNIVIDQTQAFQSPLIPVSLDFDMSSYIAQNLVPPQGAMVFEIPRSIEIAPTLPENVIVNEVASSSADAYAKTDFQAVIDGNVDEAEGDAQGPFVLAATSENAETGARVVLFGSTSIAKDTYSLINGSVNLSAAFNSFIWTTQFDEFFGTVTIQSETSPQDQPVFADEQTLRNASFVTNLLLPFGVLAIGLFIWWNSRERERAQASR
jgi:hypothetical protein